MAIWAGRAWGGTGGDKEVANHSEGLGEGGEGWRGMGTKTTYPRKVAIWTGKATATVTWTAGEM